MHKQKEQRNRKEKRKLHPVEARTTTEHGRFLGTVPETDVLVVTHIHSGSLCRPNIH